MTKIEIISGFLGAGKTTFIKKMLKEAFAGEKVVLIENEFGEIGIDGGFLKEAGVQITEMNSGCICCSLVGDFGAALKEVIETYAPDRILIEPSGVGKLSDVTKAVQGVAAAEPVELNSSVTVVDGQKCRMYMKNFGEFFNNQVENAGTIVISRTQKMSEEKLNACVNMLKEKNLTLTTAESCTAGLLAGRIMNVAGATQIYNEGYITYSNEAKEKLVGVSHGTLESHGAVSHETAAEMAEGAARAAGADASVSVTGIAGPDGGTKEKPVGLVYVGCYVKGNVRTEEFRFLGNRAKNREYAVVRALTLLREELLKA